MNGMTGVKKKSIVTGCYSVGDREVKGGVAWQGVTRNTR